MSKRIQFSVVAAGLLSAASLAFSPAVSAQGTVTSTLTAQRVETVDGKAVLKPAPTTKPGDVIAYTGSYRNGGTALADKLVAVIPVPTGTTLVAGSAEPLGAQASTDGARFEPMPLMRTVKSANGTERREAVPLAEYRALRWDVGTLAPAASSVVTLRVRVDEPAAVSVPAAMPAVQPAAKAASRP